MALDLGLTSVQYNGDRVSGERIRALFIPILRRLFSGTSAVAGAPSLVPETGTSGHHSSSSLVLMDSPAMYVCVKGRIQQKQTAT